MSDEAPIVIPYWGPQPRVRATVWWCGLPFEVVYMPLTNVEEEDLIDAAERPSPNKQVLRERIYRMAWTIDTINDKRIHFGGADAAEERARREAWVESWLSPLLYGNSDAFEQAVARLVMDPRDPRLPENRPAPPPSVPEQEPGPLEDDDEGEEG